jgi:hypothetical protein
MTDERAAELAAFLRAEGLWATFTASERRGVQFGMFPAEKMRQVEAEGYDPRHLSLGLMRLADACK